MRLGGGDCTPGSCASLGLAYIGNRAGFNVLDFRGGDSWAYFSSPKNLYNITKAVGGHVELHKNGFTCALKNLSKVVEGKEYFFVAGRHAAIVRKSNDQLEYLELQDWKPGPRINWFKPFTEEKLKSRFRCSIGIKYPKFSFLIESEKLAGDSSFKELLSAINTEPENQLKGSSGGMR